MKTLHTAAFLALTAAVASHAQQPAPRPRPEPGTQPGAQLRAQPGAQPAEGFKKLTRAEFDALLKEPGKVLVLDVRRPDELQTIGGFPVYVSIQAKDLEQHLAFLPKDRAIVTVSNHAGRAGKA